MDFSVPLNGLRQHATAAKDTVQADAGKTAADAKVNLKADMSGHQEDVTMRTERTAAQVEAAMAEADAIKPHMKVRFDRL
jgi:hypothetical protein